MLKLNSTLPNTIATSLELTRNHEINSFWKLLRTDYTSMLTKSIKWTQAVASDFVAIADKWVEQWKQVPHVRLPQLINPKQSPSDVHGYVCLSTSELWTTLAYALLFDWQNNLSSTEPRKHSKTGITKSPYGLQIYAKLFKWNA